MHLKSIELVGFKSFPDRTFIELKEGISAIVGPNGCGKSNLVDAVRWCLGEQSVKSLRSKQRVDVIFAGASGRAALNLSEVTLTFDNSDKTLPLEFSEIEVTRRLFRSGESEYFLNKTQCRLKDIQDLFLDTGLGEGSSILAQGEVDLLIRAKPEERREFFEEAAGVSKYKSRRDETLRKLERVELDCSRVRDILSMVKEEMDRMENAAKKAKLFQKLKEELRQMEMADALFQVQKMEEEIKTLETRFEEYQEQIIALQAQAASKEAERTNKRLELESHSKEMEEKRDAMLELEKQSNAFDHAIQLASQTSQQFASELERAKEEVAASVQREKELTEKMALLQQGLKEFAAQMQKLQKELELKKSEAQEAQKKKEELKKRSEDCSSRIFVLSRQQSELVNEKNSVSSQRIRRQAELESERKDLEKSSRELEAAEAELAKLKEALQVLQSLVAQKEKSAKNLKEGRQLLKEKQEQLSKEFQHLSADLARAEAEQRSLVASFEENPYRRGTQALLRERFPGLRGVVGLLLKYSENNAQWVESVLGNKLNYLVFDHLADAQKAVQFLKEKRLGRAACFILEKIPETRLPDLSSIPNANSLLRFVECQPELKKLANYLLGSAFVFGNTLYSEGVLDGGSELAPGNAGSSSANQNQFLAKERIQAELTQCKEAVQRMEAERTLLEKELLQIEGELTQAEQLLSKTALEINHQQKLIQEKEEECSTIQKEVAFFGEEIRRMEEELKSYTEKFAELQSKEEKIFQLLRLAEEERNAIFSQIKEQEAEEHEHQLKVAELEFELRRVSERAEGEENSLQELNREFWTHQKRRKELRERLCYVGKKMLQAKETIQQESAKLQEVEREKASLSREIEELLQQKAMQSELLLRLESEISALREKQEQHSGFLHQVELTLRTLQAERKNLLSKLEEFSHARTAESHARTAESFSASAGAGEIDSAAPIPAPADPEELAKLKKRIDALSNSVNLEAPEQYEKLSERYQFLTSQIEDLTRAREDLKNAIRQINATTREQFKETFNKVRENFRKVYATLFEGGEADLLLTLPEDLLETGIEIVAQPPGKKLQNISLLSGGEKALTAIALLFAFFLVKPAPFCILDEVDAPLDAANVDRFVKLLKEFSKNTQFLVVTHTPRTMEMADILYGVTMEEYGVSKILSWKVKTESEPKPKLAEELTLTSAN